MLTDGRETTEKHDASSADSYTVEA